MSNTRFHLAALVFAMTTAPAAAQTPAVDALPWVGHAAEMEAHLRSADIVRLEDVDVGVTQPRRGYLMPDTPFASIVWKPLRPGRYRGFWESYKSEIAAYELDKLLAMNMVPPAAEREVDGERGAAVMWIDGTKSVKQLGGKVPTGPAFGRPIRMMQLFDNVIGNPDRNAGNILVDASDHVILIDHSRAFTEDRRLPFPFERVDEALWTKVQALTRETLARALSTWLDEIAIGAMLARRDAIGARVDDLVRRRGRAAVIIP